MSILQPLTADTHTRFKSALLKSFAELPTLEELTFAAFGLKLDVIVSVQQRGLNTVVYELIEWAIDHRCFQQLMSVASERRPEDAELAAIVADTGSIEYYFDIPEHSSVITRDQYRQLLEILSPLVSDESTPSERWEGRFYNTYMQLLPFGAQRIGTHALRPIICDLCKYGQQMPDNTLPILSFAQHLLIQLEDETTKIRLKQWLETTARALQMSINVPPIPSNLSQRRLPYLTIELMPSEVDINNPKQQRYLVEVVYWSADHDDPTLWYPNQESDYLPVVLDRVPEILDSVFTNDSYMTPIEPEAIDQLVLEFIVPYELISYPFDAWVPTFLPDSTYGRQQPIVVRALERLNNRNPFVRKKLRSYWEKKWSILRSAMSTRTIYKHIRWMEAVPTFNRDQFGEEIRNDNTVLCLGCPSCPPHLTEFEAWLWAGAATGIWVRPGESADMPRHNLRAMLEKPPHASVSISGLLDWARQLRIAAAADPTHLGHTLTVLWDDADRIPTKYR